MWTWFVLFRSNRSLIRLLRIYGIIQQKGVTEIGMEMEMKGRCMMCGRTLTNPESVARGIGPVCYKKYVDKKGIRKKVILSAIEHQQTLI